MANETCRGALASRPKVWKHPAEAASQLTSRVDRRDSWRGDRPQTSATVETHCLRAGGSVDRAMISLTCSLRAAQRNAFQLRQVVARAVPAEGRRHGA